MNFRSGLDIVFVLAVAVPVHAESLHVPREFPTIGAAIAAAQSGDEIVVAPGIYTEAIDFAGKTLVLRSSGGAGQTTLSGAGLSTSIVRCATQECCGTELRGFTLTGGSAGTQSGDYRFGGAAFVSDQAHMRIADCVFQANHMSGNFLGGGAIMCSGAESLVIEDCVFANNTLTHAGSAELVVGAGICASPNDAGVVPTVHVARCHFEGNKALEGGAVWVSSSSPDTTPALYLEDCTLTGSQASRGGGAVYAANSIGSFVRCAFLANAASQDEGGAMKALNSSWSFVNCEFVGNTARAGGALFLETIALQLNDPVLDQHIERCTFTKNSCGGPGADGFGGAVRLYRTNTTIKDSAFRLNNASRYGGAVNAWYSSTRFLNCEFQWNSALNGGALLLASFVEAPLAQQSMIVNCTITDNSASQPAGIGGVLVPDFWTPIRLTNCIIRGNLSSTGTSNLWCEGSTPEGWALLSHCNVDGGVSGAITVDSGFDLDPGFVNRSAGDLSLLADSACRDRGDPWDPLVENLTTDAAGNPRSLDSNGDGFAMPDVGAYEVAGSPAPAAETAPNLHAYWHFNGGGSGVVPADEGSGLAYFGAWEIGESETLPFSLNRLKDTPRGSQLTVDGAEASDGAPVEFELSMKGRVGLKLTFACSMVYMSYPGVQAQSIWELSVNGADFAQVGSVAIGGGKYGTLEAIDLSGVPGVNGAENVRLRMHMTPDSPNVNFFLDNVRFDSTRIEDLLPADLTQDGVVDGADLGVLIGAWGDCSGCPADLTGDGMVNGEDLGLLLGAWNLN